MSALTGLWERVEFSEPLYLLLALLAGPVFWLAYRSGGRIVFSSFRLLPSRAASLRARLAWIPALLLALATAAMSVALAGPRVLAGQDDIRREGIAIMMVVDTSGSMAALDLSEPTPSGVRERTRLDAVKEVFEQFVQGGGGLPGRPDDLIGIVSFAGFADTRCPLTLNHGSLVSIARDLALVTDRAEDGTAMGDGLALAVERLRQTKATSRVAILLTDGVSNAGVETPTAAAELAYNQGIKVYTVGAGTNGLAPVRLVDPWTGQSELRRVPVEIDEETLEAVAERTGGQYFRATDASGLRQVYQQIDQLERTEISEQRLAEYSEYYLYALGLAMILAALSWLLGATVFRRLPC